MTEAQIKHVEILQSIITRMAQNSFAIKSWAITVIAALLAFNAKDADRRVAFLAIYPALAFWGLDAYYVMKERQFRELRPKVEEGKEFSFEIQAATGSAYFSAAFSRTVFPLYVLSLVAAVVLMLSAR